MKDAPGVETNELNSSFSVVISEVGALKSYRQMNRLTPKVSRMRCLSILCRQYVQTMRPYMMVVQTGTSAWGMKSMVSVPGISRMPCARQPSSLAKNFIQMSRHLSILIRWKTQEMSRLHHQWLLCQSPRWGNFHALSPAVTTAEAHGLLHHNLASICVVGFWHLCLV